MLPGWVLRSGPRWGETCPVRHLRRRTAFPRAVRYGAHRHHRESPPVSTGALNEHHHEGHIESGRINGRTSEARPRLLRCAVLSRRAIALRASRESIASAEPGGKRITINYQIHARSSHDCSSRRNQLTTLSSSTSPPPPLSRRVDERAHPVRIVPALPAPEVAGPDQRASRGRRVAVERARYDADRAERAFGAVEPENRLVARSREARWKGRGSPPRPKPKSRHRRLPATRCRRCPAGDDLEKLAADLPALWNAPTTSARDGKRLLRTLIADVTVLPGPDRGKARIGIAGTPAPPTSSPSTGPPTPAPPGARQTPPSNSSTARAYDQDRRRVIGLLPPDRRSSPRSTSRWSSGSSAMLYKIPVRNLTAPARSRGRGRPRGGCSTSVDDHWIHTGQLHRPPRLRQPVLHPLEPAAPSRLPAPDRAIRHLDPAARVRQPRQRRLEGSQECRCHLPMLASPAPPMRA